MRVTDSYRIRTVIENLNASRDRMNTLQQQLATAKKINVPSDDPTGTTKAMRLRTVLEVANTKFGGKYLFGGTETKSQPFTLDENVLNQNLDSEVVTYRGDSKTFKRQINEHTAIDINLPGSKVFDMSSEGGINIFQEIYELRNNFKDSPLKIDRQKMDQSLDNLDKSIDQLLNAFLNVGTRKQISNFNKTRFESQNITLKERLSNIEDTDFGTAFIQFKAEENALNSALSAGARVISPSLLDFLKI